MYEQHSQMLYKMPLLPFIHLTDTLPAGSQGRSASLELGDCGERTNTAGRGILIVLAHIYAFFV
jgi:hypothetical protein